MARNLREWYSHISHLFRINLTLHRHAGTLNPKVENRAARVLQLLLLRLDQGPLLLKALRERRRQHRKKVP